jgi:hypothetical protein
VYLRLNEGETWDLIPQALLEDCAQLTKANSIEGTLYPYQPNKCIRCPTLIQIYVGNKKDNIAIIYTPWRNLHKDGSMATGQVSFKDPKLTKKILIPTRTNAIVNRLNKTKVEKFPDLRAEKEEHLKQLRRKEQKERDERKAEEKSLARERSELKYQKDHAYDDLMSEENVRMSSNQDRASDWEDDFM